MGELVRKRGRPVSERSKRNTKIIRLTDDELYMLEYVARNTGKTFTDILVEGLADQYEKCVDLGFEYYDDYDYDEEFDE